MQKQIIECIPNFSEGRNMDVIKQITDEIEKVSGITLLDVDPGQATNRTVVTFVGEPDAVLEAAFQAVTPSGLLMYFAPSPSTSLPPKTIMRPATSRMGKVRRPRKRS